jgi:bifunctional DNase/RNase
MEREMKIRGLLMDPTTNSPIVLLKDLESELMLPIWVGPFEANSIASEIEKIAPQRPMTHDLLKNIICELGGQVQRIIVTELRDNTFYAMIEVLVNGSVVFIDSRPSDAIALALRADCPIYVREEVIQSSHSNQVDTLDEDLSGDDEVEWPEEIGDISDYKM